MVIDVRICNAHRVHRTVVLSDVSMVNAVILLLFLRSCVFGKVCAAHTLDNGVRLVSLLKLGRGNDFFVIPLSNRAAVGRKRVNRPLDDPSLAGRRGVNGHYR